MNKFTNKQGKSQESENIKKETNLESKEEEEE